MPISKGAGILPLEAGGWQENDQTVSALLQKGQRRWRPALLWRLTRDHEYPRSCFERELRKLRQPQSLLDELFE